MIVFHTKFGETPSRQQFTMEYEPVSDFTLLWGKTRVGVDLPRVTVSLEKTLVVPISAYYGHLSDFVKSEIRKKKLTLSDSDPNCIRTVSWQAKGAPAVTTDGLHLLMRAVFTVEREVFEEGSTFYGKLVRKRRFTAVKFGKHNIVLDDPRADSLPNEGIAKFKVVQRSVNSGKYWYVCSLAGEDCVPGRPYG